MIGGWACACACWNGIGGGGGCVAHGGMPHIPAFFSFSFFSFLFLTLSSFFLLPSRSFSTHVVTSRVAMIGSFLYPNRNPWISAVENSFSGMRHAKTIERSFVVVGEVVEDEMRSKGILRSLYRCSGKNFMNRAAACVCEARKYSICLSILPGLRIAESSLSM